MDALTIGKQNDRGFHRHRGIQIQTLSNFNITILRHYITNYVESSVLSSCLVYSIVFNLNHALFNSQDSVQPVKIKEEGLEGLAELVSFGSGQLRDEQEDGDDPDYQVKVTKIHLGMIDLFSVFM